MQLEERPASIERQDNRTVLATQLLFLAVAATLFYAEAVPRFGGGWGGNVVFDSFWRFGWPHDCAEKRDTYNLWTGTITTEWRFDRKAIVVDSIVVASTLIVPSIPILRRLITRRRGQFKLRWLFVGVCLLAVAIAILRTHDEYGEPDWQYVWTKLFGAWPPITFRALLVGACVVAEILYLAAMLFRRRKPLVEH